MKKQLWILIQVVVATFALGGLLWAYNSPPDTNDGSQKNPAQLGRETSPTSRSTDSQGMLAEEVRHRLAMLPWYNVFDWLEAEVTPEGEVTLRGQVIRPVTKLDAQATVKHIKGVTGVKNEIEVLPLSTFDDGIRVRVYRSIYNFNSPLFRYSEGAVPPIHIIVKNGNVTLKGVVATNMDSQLAYMAANRIPGVFGVTNDLQVEQSKRRRG